MNLELVKEYYGKVLQTSKDLKTSACCEGGGMPAHLEPLLANVHEEVRAKYYGCGIVVPTALQGCRVLDLGSGSGRDVYMISQLVGSMGEIVGVDMTDEQLETARSHIDWHMRAFGYTSPNVKFLKGYIENLGELGLEPQSFDVIVSNCVINLSVDKPAVLRGAYELLKPAARFTGTTSFPWRSALASSIRGSLRAIRSRSRTTRWSASSARRNSSQQLIGCSSSTDWRQPAKTTAKQSSTEVGWRSSQMPSSSTAITSSSAGKYSTCVAIPGGCWLTRALPRISTSSAISRPITGSSLAAGPRFPLRRPRQRQRAGPAVVSRSAFDIPVRTERYNH
jgi:SAM-dependent methyltransferase